MDKKDKKVYYVPSYLSKDKIAADEWRRIIKIIDTTFFTEMDLKTLEIYVNSYSRYRQSEKVLKDEGYFFSTESGYKQVHPSVSISNKAIEIMQSTAKELGFTSASRIRMAKNSGVNEKGGGKQELDEEMNNMIN